MAWKITHDLIAEGDEPNAVGIGQPSDGDMDDPIVFEGATFAFRLYDDDGEHYYTGKADRWAADCDELDGGLYVALRWAEVYAGCTDLRVRAGDRHYHGLTSPSDTGWVSIYA